MRKVNTISLLVNCLFLLIYIFPIRFFINLTGLEIDKYIFLGICLLIYIIWIAYTKKIEIKEILFLIVIASVSIIKKTLEPFVLFEYLLLYKILKNNSDAVKISNKILFISVFGVLFYSIIYFGKLKGYLCTGLMEINQSAFLIFFLFLLIYKRNKKLGLFLLSFGIITLSRNYLLCLLLFLILKGSLYQKLFNILNFKKLLAISFVFLGIFSYSFDYAYEHNMISKSYNDYRKYIYIYDYSNYFRFSTNYDLIELYFKHPSKLLTGIDEEEFIRMNRAAARAEGKLYRPILPHNYFFSYFRIYGIFCVFIFMFLEKIINVVCNKNNFFILLILFVYANILGIGFTNYYLFLTMFTMLEFSGGLYEKYNNSDKNI